MTGGTSQKTAVVTGAARGIGAAIAHRLATDGSHVIIADRDFSAAASLSNRLTERGLNTVAVQCDVTDAASVKAMVAETVGVFGRLDHLVNCAGAYVAPRPIQDVAEETWDLVLDSNLKGTFLCIRAAMPHMIKQRYGRIVNISSNAARSTATALGVEYTAAKAGVLGVTRHVAREGAAHNVLANAIAPGPTQGERLDAISTPAELEQIATTIPIGRLGLPAEIANVASFLLSDESSFMTGATLDVNGGIVMV